MFPNGTSQTLFGPFSADTTFEKITWRVALKHNFTDDLMGYGSINTGFKSGGFNSARPIDPPFKPEEIEAYEIGLKSDLMNKRLRLNMSAFYYDYKNIQVRRRDSGLIAIFNGPASEIYGFDLDFDLIVTRHLTVSGGFELLEHSFTNFADAAVRLPNSCPTAPTTANGFVSCPDGSGRFIGGTTDAVIDVTGNALPYTSDLMLNVSADYRVPVEFGELQFSATYSYSDGYYFEPDNTRKQDGFSNLNAVIGWTDPSDRYFVRIWGRNLTKELVINQYAAQREGEQIFFGPTRTIGITAGINFSSQ